LHSTFMTDTSISEKIMTPYNFPNMPLEKTTGEEKITATGYAFKRIGFDENGNLSLDVSGKCKANKVFGDMNESALEIEEKAYEKGFENGERDALELVEKRIEPVVQSFREAAIALEETKKAFYLSAEREAVELALAIAKKIVCHEISINKKAVINIVKEALKKIVDHKKIIIRLAPSDIRTMKDAKIQASSLTENLENVILEEDETIMDGGCVIETDLGEIDARIENQIQAVEEAFNSEINKLRIGR